MARSGSFGSTMLPQRNLVSVLTPRGRGAVATIVCVGDAGQIDAANVFHAANGKTFSEQSLNRIAFGRWGRDPAEEVVVCRVASDRIEIHCHGGDAAVERILVQITAAGAEKVPWPELIERTEGPFARDAAEALAAAATARTAAIISHQSAGPLREFLVWLSGVDLAAQRDAVLDRFDRTLAWSEFGRHLTQPWRVVLYGAPNVGKSSLINALAGFERAIVFDQPGTTRDVVTVETAFNGWPVRLSDTAGIRSSRDEVEAAGITRAKRELATADLRICVCDGSDANLFDVLQVDEVVPSLVVVNKCDLPQAAAKDLPHEALCVSARTNVGLPELMTVIAERLVPRMPDADEGIPFSECQIEHLSEAREALAKHDIERCRRHLAVLRGAFDAA